MQRNTILYGAFALLLIWMIYFNDFTVGDYRNFLPYLPESIASMSLSVFLLPLLVSTSIFYVASLFGTVFEGTVNELVVGSLYAAGFAIFFALFLIYSPASKTLSSTGFMFLAAFVVLFTYNILAIISNVWGVPALKAIAASVTIYAVGHIVIRITNLFVSSSGVPLSGELGGALTHLIHIGFLVAAAISLLAVLKTSQNVYLSFVGEVASNYVLIVPASLFGSLYFNYFQGKLAIISPTLANLSPYIEWTVICIVAALIYRRTHKGIRASAVAEAQLGDWMKHIQEVSTYKEGRFVRFTGMINDFIEEGRRDRLLVSLATFLHENKVGDEKISLMLSDLINYEDAKKPAFSMRGRNLVIDMENKTQRSNVLKKTLINILPPGFNRSNGEGKPTGGDADSNAPSAGLDAPSQESEANLFEMDG